MPVCAPALLARRAVDTGTHTMPAAQTGNPSTDLLFPTDSERVRSGSARRRVKAKKTRQGQGKQ
jgi:hypothetical protein